MPRSLDDALNASGFPFAHFGWSRAPAGDYGVWSEEQGADFVANGGHAETGTELIVDLFTRQEGREPRQRIETILDAFPSLSWHLDSVQFEIETGYVHWQWRLFAYSDY